MSSITSGAPVTTTSISTQHLTALHDDEDPRPSATSVVATLRHSPRLLLRKSANGLKEPVQSPDIFARGPGPSLRASTRLQTKNTSARLRDARTKKASRQQLQQQQQQQQEFQRQSERPLSRHQMTEQNDTSCTPESKVLQETATKTLDATSTGISTTTTATTTTMITTSASCTNSSKSDADMVPDSRIQKRPSRATGHLSITGTSSTTNRTIVTATSTAEAAGAVGAERRSRITTRSSSHNRDSTRSRTKTRTRTHVRAVPLASPVPGDGEIKSDDDDDDDGDNGMKSYLLRNRSRHHRRPRSGQKLSACAEPDHNTSSLFNMTLTPRLTRLGARHESAHALEDEIPDRAHRNRHDGHGHVEDKMTGEHSHSHSDRRSRSATSSSSLDSRVRGKDSSSTGSGNCTASSTVPYVSQKTSKASAYVPKVPTLPACRRRLWARTTKVAKMGIDKGAGEDDEAGEDREEEEEEEGEEQEEQEHEEDEEEAEDDDELEEIDYDDYARSDGDEEMVDEGMMDVDQSTLRNLKRLQHQQQKRHDNSSQSRRPSNEDMGGTCTSDAPEGFIASKPEISNVSGSPANSAGILNVSALYQLHAKRKVEDEDMEDQVATMSVDEGQVVSTKLARIDETADSAEKNEYLKTFYNILKSPRGDDDDGILSSESEDADLESEDDDDDFEEIDVWEFIATLPPLGPLPNSFVFTMPERTDLTPPITLVLDIDETLVHCATRPLESPDIIFPVEYNQETWEVYGRIRPGMLEFLEKMSAKFEVITFTASQECYAEALLKIIDPEKRFIRHRYYRDSCVPVFGNYVKDLRILNRDLSKVVIIDNSPQAFGYQISNGIPIESWYDDKSDRELAKVMSFLETLEGAEDVRPMIDEQYRLQDRIQRAMTQASHQQISSMGGLGSLGTTLGATPSSGEGLAESSSSSCSTSGTNSMASLQSILPEHSTLDAATRMSEGRALEDDFSVLQTLTSGGKVAPNAAAKSSASNRSSLAASVGMSTTTATGHTMNMTTRSNNLDATHNLAKISL
ncbi:hypothetical protein BG004_000031 [Podila humilis]|nr:hypothetical protein BG004_000031 [Podila humilis]